MIPIKVNGNNVLNAFNMVINFTIKDEKGNNTGIRLTANADIIRTLCRLTSGQFAVIDSYS
jgi:hypothetical protein